MHRKKAAVVIEKVSGTTTLWGCRVRSRRLLHKLPGYRRTSDCTAAPLRRAHQELRAVHELVHDALDIVAFALPEIRFVPENIRMEQSLYATEEAYRLVVDQGLPFRDAYRRVGNRYRDPE